MNTTPNQITRFIAIDAHKHYLVIGGLNSHMEIVLPLCRVSIHRFPDWAHKNLLPSDAVVIESTTNSWALYDTFHPLVASAVVANPYQVKLIAAARVKTDKHDVWSLARLLVADLIPEVWVPPVHVRELRALVAHRRRLVQSRTRARNRLQSLLHRHNLSPPVSRPFAHKYLDWWLSLDLSPIEHIRIRSDLDTLVFAQTQVTRLQEAILLVAIHDERALFLIQLPGVGLITAITLLAAIGDEGRFPTAKHLVGYSGLGCRVHDSGLTHYSGRITKAGRRDIRAAMVEAAHTACRTHPHWKAELARLEPRLGKNKAIVAIARKLLVAVWHVLNERCADRFADPEMVARKLAQYAYTLGRDNRPDGQSVGEFVRQQLDCLDIGADLDAIQFGKRTLPMPPSSLAAADD